ncbi:MAG: MOSC domain-containing protein [Chloroflexi bacterium]|nr:MOSC domain-containing protein [Chloroflexota bacterium]
MAHVAAVCASERRSDPKLNVGEAELRAGYGLVGDAHAGVSVREVSLLGLESIEEVNRIHGINARPGSFAENITTSGFDLLALRLGDRLLVGPALLEVVQIGKPPDAAHTYAYQGLSLLPRKGIFCRVLRGGHIAQGDIIQRALKEKQ